MILHNNLFQVTREQIKLLLLSPESSDIAKEWGIESKIYFFFSNLLTTDFKKYIIGIVRKHT